MRVHIRLLTLPVILTLIVPVLTSCSSQKTQKAIIFIEDATTEGRPLEENLSIFGSSKESVKFEIIEAASKAQSDSKKTEKLNYVDDCDNGNGCFYLDGRPLSENEVMNYYDEREGFEISLPVDENNKAVLKVSDGENSGEWLVESSNSEQPIYLTMLVTDFWVSVTELEDGKVTYSSIAVSKQTPENTWYFKELFKEELPYYFERDNPWVQFRLMFQKYSIAESTARDDVCKVFGDDCEGNAPYSSIAQVYRKALDNVITPMLSELSTNSDDKNVSVALLKLEKIAKLLSDCYYQVYTAADSRDDTSYQATNKCFSEVDQQQSDVEIYLKEYSQQLTGFMRGGYH